MQDSETVTYRIFQKMLH